MKNIIDENEAMQLKEGISILSPNAVTHSKAAEEYIEVRFPFGNQTWNLWIPIVYRRNGLYLEYPGADAIDNEENLAKRNDLYDYLNKASKSIPKSNEEVNE